VLGRTEAPGLVSSFFTVPLGVLPSGLTDGLLGGMVPGFTEGDELPGLVLLPLGGVTDGLELLLPGGVDGFELLPPGGVDDFELLPVEDLELLPVEGFELLFPVEGFELLLPVEDLELLLPVEGFELLLLVEGFELLPDGFEELEPDGFELPLPLNCVSMVWPWAAKATIPTASNIAKIRFVLTSSKVKAQALYEIIYLV